MAKRKSKKGTKTKKSTTSAGRRIPYGTPEYERYAKRKAAERRRRGFISYSDKKRGLKGGTASGKGSRFTGVGSAHRKKVK